MSVILKYDDKVRELPAHELYYTNHELDYADNPIFYLGAIEKSKEEWNTGIACLSRSDNTLKITDVMANNAISTDAYGNLSKCISASADPTDYLNDKSGVMMKAAVLHSIRNYESEIDGEIPIYRTISMWIYKNNIYDGNTLYPFAVMKPAKATAAATGAPFFPTYGICAGFKLTNDYLVFETEHYFTGSYVNNYLYDDRWNHVMVEIVAKELNEESAMNLYINGDLISTLSARFNTDITKYRFRDDIVATLTADRAIWQVPNYFEADGGAIADFTVFDYLLLDPKSTDYIVPNKEVYEYMYNHYNLYTYYIAVNSESTRNNGVNQSAGKNTGANDGEVPHDNINVPEDATGSVVDNKTKGVAYVFKCQIDVPERSIGQTFNASMIVGTSNTVVTVEIPFPYKKFTDMEFFCTKPDGEFIPQYYYDRIDEHHIRFKNGNPMKLDDDERGIRFTFLHKQGFYHVQKYEQTSFLQQGQTEVQLNTPYDNIVDLNLRVRVFVNRQFIYPDSSSYIIDRETGIVSFSTKFLNGFGNGTKEIDFLCFYTGTHKNDLTVPKLPMSGYIEFMKRHADRIWDKDLFAAFVNGKLIDRDDIIDMTSRTHKIGTDIKTRYNLEVKNLSPRISYLVPYLEMRYKHEDKGVINHKLEFPCTMKVYYPTVKQNRYFLIPENTTVLNPVEYMPMVPNHQDFYITLLHHGLGENPDGDKVRYSLNFYRDDYWPNADEIMVTAMVRPKTNMEEFVPTSDTRTIMGVLPTTITNTMADAPMFSIQASTVYKADTNINYLKPDAVDGIMCRFEFYKTKKDIYKRLYYSLYASYYERDAQVGVFEWVISSGVNATGRIYYRKTINFVPFNEIDRDIFDGEYDEDTTYTKHDKQYNRYDWIYDGGFGDSGYFIEEDEYYKEQMEAKNMGDRNSNIETADVTISKTSSYAGDNGGPSDKYKKDKEGSK